MTKRRKILLIALPFVIAIIIGAVLLTRTPQTTLETPSPGSPTENPETPPNLLVVPEVPLGTVAVLLACFSALLIAQKRSKSKLP